MAGIPERKKPFKFSNCGLPPPTEIEPAPFFDELRRMPAEERMAMVRTWVQERSPVGFSKNPYLWEAAREWIAKRHGLSPRQIGLAGSAQVGFSTNPKKAFSRFNPEGSDLDLYIVSTQLYSIIEKEALLFIERQRTAVKTDYLSQAETTERCINNGYIDLWHIPAFHDRYPVSSHLKNDASILIDKLALSGYKLKPSNFRIYRDWRDKANWTSIQAKSWAEKLIQASNIP